MRDWLWHWVDTSGFPPRWTCGSGWTEEPTLGWLHIFSDIATFAAYFAVPCVVAAYVLRKPEVKTRFPKVFWIFLALVFFSCGTVHLLEAGMFWWPHYRLSAVFKVLTAIVSCVGVGVLVRSLPHALNLKTPEQLQAEVNERREAEAKLGFERNLLHTLMNHLPDAIYFKDASGKFLRVSQSLADNLNLKDASEAIGRSESDFLECGEKCEADDELVFRTGESIIGRVEKAPWQKPKEAWMSTSRLLLRGSDNEPLGTFGISHDITPVKRSEERLALLAHKLAMPRESDAHPPLQLSRFCLGDMISCGSDIRAMGLQSQSRAVLERNLVEYLYRRMKDDDGQPAFALVRLFQTTAFKNLDDDLQQLARAAAREYDLQPDTRCLVLRGTAGLDPKWNDPLRSEGHRVIPLPNVKVLEQLPMIAQLIRQLGINAGGIVDGYGKLLMEDVEANVFHVPNAVDSELIPAQDDFVIPYKIESVVGFGDLLPNGDLFALICFSRVPIHHPIAVLFSHLSISAKLALLAVEPPGDLVEEQIQAVDALLRNYEHVVCDQETTLKHAMNELEKARDAADNANRAKSEFLANMSHEIRTPMNAILGMTELVLEGDVSATEREYLSTVLDSGESLLGIINEILDFSKIEAGKLELELSPFDIREEIGDMVRSLAIRAHRKGVELAYEVDSDVPHFVVSDVARLRQVIVNLTGNAIKFTDKGEVVVRVAASNVTPDSADIQFSVADTGIGIPLDKRDSIFDAFVQADASTTRIHGGTGLGLAISANIVRKMGGKFKLESQLGEGSRFSFTIRAAIGKGADGRTRQRPENLRGHYALLVDDNETNLHILEKMLESWQLQTICVTNARQALDVLENWDQQSKPLPIVVSDVHMPVMDGFQMIEQIRGNDKISDAVVIVLTSGTSVGDPERCQRLNIAAHIMKPVKPTEILNALLVAYGNQVGLHEAPPADNADPLPHRPLRVLLVEDGAANQKLAVGMLRRWGHTAEIADHGAAAVEMYRSSVFDLVLMDLQMPVMDGLEATKQIREIEAASGQHVPIIAMTAHALVGDRQRCLQAGMDYYLSKPIRRKDLAAAIERFFDPVEVGLRTDSSADRDVSADTLDPTGPAPTIELDDALAMMENDRSILNAVVKAFMEESPVLLQRLADAIASGDQAVAVRAAHTLKGNFRILGQLELHENWGRVEALASQGLIDDLREPVEQATEMTRWALEQFALYLERQD